MMAASATDVDRTRWVENETTLKPEPSFENKKQKNVNKFYFMFTLNCIPLMLGGLFTNTKSSVYIFPLLEYFKTSSPWKVLFLHDSNVSSYCSVS